MLSLYKKQITVFFLIFIFILAGPSEALAVAKKQRQKPKPALLQIAGWLPYWRKATSTAEALAHLSAFTEISPFHYSVKHDGTLFDTMGIGEEPWTSAIETAQASGVKVIPTIMWGNPDDMHAILKNPKKRKAHVRAIVSMVKSGNFDGVDIDYESKYAKTKLYFSLFLKELWGSIGNKIVSCTIEPRTPLEDRFKVIPKDIEYSNDYASINKYCDRVRIMTYDQGSADLSLNESAMGPYIPVADPDWVKKVITLASKTISKKKIMIGVATYGYEYTVTPILDGYSYDRETAFNPNYAWAIASSSGVNPVRNKAGELSFAYVPTSTPLSTSMAILPNSPSLDTSAFAQASVTNSTGTTTGGVATAQPFRLLWWSDSQAIKDKVELARQLGVRGIAIFKIDGGADPGLWEVLK